VVNVPRLLPLLELSFVETAFLLEPEEELELEEELFELPELLELLEPLGFL